jgi:hypothetical protein
MVSPLLFSLSAACFVAMFLPQRPSRPRQELETYYVCGNESLLNPESEVGSSAFSGASYG